MAELRKYGESTTIYFPLITRGAVDFDATPVVHAAGDSQISIDGGAFANTNAGFNHEGNGIYSIVLSIAELTGKKMIITIIDQGAKAYEDQAVSIVTFGHASAEYIWDFDNATPTVDATKISGSSTAADNVQSVYTGTGVADDVDLAARSLTISNDIATALAISCTDPGSVGMSIVCSTGPAATLESTGGNGDALRLFGHGTGSGAWLKGGVTGKGANFQGGSTSGSAIYGSTTNGAVLFLTATAGRAVDLRAAGSGKETIYMVSAGGRNIATSAASGYESIKIVGINAAAVLVEVTTGDGDALSLVGKGTGSAAKFRPGATGDTIDIASTNGDCFKIVAAGTGKNAIDLSAAVDGKALEINQKTKSGSEDIMQLIYSRLAGKNTMANTGGSSEIEMKLYNYAEGSAVKTITMLKPDASDNTETLNVNALAGMEE